MLELFAAIAAEVVLSFVLFMPISNDVCGKAVEAIEGSFDFDDQGKLGSPCFTFYT